MTWQDRSLKLLGSEKILRLNNAHVVVCGLGGVGSFAAEALVRSGVGHLTLCDFDQVSESNINRQLPATHESIGEYKVDVLARHYRDINPEIHLDLIKERLNYSRIKTLLVHSKVSYLADAIDDLEAKADLIQQALALNLPIISSMGAGFRLDPSHIQISDISKTHTCPLARRLRKRLKDKGIEQGLPVVWSDERPLEAQTKEPGPASMIFVPASTGLQMASYIVRNLIYKES